MGIKRNEVPQSGGPPSHLDLGNDEPKVLTTKNFFTSRNDRMELFQDTDSALNIGDVFHGKTPHLSSSTSPHSIYSEESMADFTQENSHGHLELQPNNHHNSSSFTEPSSNFMVRSLSIQPNCTPSLGMGGETHHYPHSGPSVSSTTDNGEPKPGSPNIWVQRMDVHSILSDQITLLRGIDHGILS